MVNKERIQLLIDALRSGKYKQGRKKLTTVVSEGPDNRFEEDCCLGVACKVAIANGLAMDVGVHRVESGNTFKFYDGSCNVLPRSVQDWYGIGSDNPVLVTENPLDSQIAASLNDQSRLTFDQLADAFERTYIKEDI